MANHVEMLSIVLADDAAAGFASVDLRTTQAILTCEGNAVRWRADGTDPTATVGVLMAVGDTVSFMGAGYHDLLTKFRIVNDSAGSNGTIQGAGFDGLDRA